VEFDPPHIADDSAWVILDLYAHRHCTLSLD
jgi:hypothetical protein